MFLPLLYLGQFAVSLVLSFLLTPLVGWLAQHFGVMDAPDL